MKLMIFMAVGLVMGLTLLGEACSAPPSGQLAEVVQTTQKDSGMRLIISRDFGQTILLDRKMEIQPRSNALSVLQQAARVETGYGGGFVESIDDLRSGYSGSKTNKQDWFYTVNGLAANTGALDYPLQPGDIEQWDFHNWSFRQLLPAMIGHFPQPFSGGVRGRVFPTRIVYSAPWEKAAVRIRDFLKEQGVNDVQVTTAGQLSENDQSSCHLIVIGSPPDPLLVELNREWKRLGFFAYFRDLKLTTIDASGQIKAEYSSQTGVIQATQNPWNPDGIGAGQTTVWMVSGCDEVGLQAALEALLNPSAGWGMSYGVIVQKDNILKLP
jgi:hypothetical protein